MSIENQRPTPVYDLEYSDKTQIEFHEWSLPTNTNKSTETAATLIDESPSLLISATLPSNNFNKITFHSIKYPGECLYIWIGESGPSLKLANLSCSMSTPYARDPLTSEIFSSTHSSSDTTTSCPNIANQISSDLALKLVRRLGKKQIFVSFNVRSILDAQATSSVLNEYELALLQAIERCLFAEIKSHPSKF